MPRIMKVHIMRKCKPAKSKSVPRKRQQQNAYIPTAEKPQIQQQHMQKLKHLATVLAQQTRNELIRQAEDNLILMIYNKLHGLIYSHCGISDNEEFLAWFSEWNEFYNADFYQRLEAKCGIKFSVRNIRGFDDPTTKSSKLADIFIRLKGEGKVCTVTVDDKPVELNFAELIVENSKRKDLWQKSEDALAKYCIDQCRLNLDDLSCKYLGIPLDVTICFEGEINFFDDDIHYQYLNQIQLFRLQSKMNQLIAHGKVTISASEDGIRVTMHKAPEKTNGTYFDYANFYSQYDNKITPELLEFYQKLFTHLELLPEDLMYKTLEFKNQLFYWFDNTSPSWEEVASRLNDGIHKQTLLDAVNQTLLGIQMTDVSCKQKLYIPENCISATCHPDTGYLEFSFKIVNPHDEFVKTVIQRQKKLHDFKKKAIAEFTSLINNYVLRIAERFIASKSGKALIERSQGNTLPSIKVIIDNHAVLLESIRDIYFIEELKREVKKQSAGFITINQLKNKKWEYYLNI